MNKNHLNLRRSGWISTGAGLISMALVILVAASTASAGSRERGKSLSFSNTSPDVLAVIAAEGGFEGHELDRRTLGLDEGYGAYRFGGRSECASVARIELVNSAGGPAQVAGLSAVTYLPNGDAQSAKITSSISDGFSMLLRGEANHRMQVTFALGVNSDGAVATFTKTIDHRFDCDRITPFQIEVESSTGIRGAVDVDSEAAAAAAELFGGVALPLLDTRKEALNNFKSTPLPAIGGSLSKAGDSTSTCDFDTFDVQSAEWQIANIGDADQASAIVSGGELNLTADGTSLYHGTDNGGFFYQERAGGFRMEVDLVDIPVDAGGDFRKAGVMVRASSDPSAERVFIEFVPHNPFTNTSSLQFDYRGSDGVSTELASTPMGLSLPLRLAVDRRGDTFTVYFSTDAGKNWVRPAGGAGGSVDLSMPDTVQIGMMVASYDTTTTLTATYDNFRLCEPNKIPLPEPPPGVICAPGRPIDLIHVIDASGSMTAPFGPGETKLDAVRNAMIAMHDVLEQDLPGSRSAVIAYSGGFNDRQYNLTSSVHVLAELTSDLNSVDSAALQIDQGVIHPDSTTPLPFALQRTTAMLEDLGDLDSLPIVVLWTDGFPNVDNQGWDALFYRNQEMRELSLYDGSGNFMSWGDVAWTGNYNPFIGTYDGEVFANTMVEIETLKNTISDALIYSVAIQSDSIFKEDLLQYAAWYTSAEVLSVQTSISLVEGLTRIVDGLDCGGDIGDYVWDDANADGIQDAAETGLAGVTVSLVNEAGDVVATAVTDADGLYLFADADAGTYTVVVDASTLPTDYQATWDLDGIETLGVASVTLLDDQVIDTVDFGYQYVETGEPWCPRTPGYWKNHLEMWPVTQLTLGGVVYDEAEILEALQYNGPDAATRLAKHLATTMLNLAMGSDTSVQPTVDASNAFLVEHPPGSNPRGQDRNTANDLKDILDTYNNAPACH